MDPGTPNTRVVLHISHDSDIAVARRAVREIGVQAGLSKLAIAALSTAVTEIARNILVHAGTGEVEIGAVAEWPRHGVSVTARDNGPGIQNLAQAMCDGLSTRGGLGLGLSSAQRLVDEFDIESTIGGGTTVMLRKWS
jgi:serine/threonine-protein kinase RsbT